MEGAACLVSLEQTIGAAIVATVLTDVYLTVLYARMGTGVISRHLGRTVWRVFRASSKPFGRHRQLVLSFCGPTILVLLVGSWAALLAVGTGLMIHPALGHGVVASYEPTPTDLLTALYAGAGSMSIVGPSDFMPRTTPYRLLYVFNSVVGMSVLTLTLTYLMQIYAALLRRNRLGLKTHLAAGETADAAELIARLGPDGHFDVSYTLLAEMAAELVDAKESHHFYPVLMRFRFREPYYSVSRFTFVALDAVTLIETALDERRYGWLKRSAPVTQIWAACMLLLSTLVMTFFGGAAPEHRVDDRTRDEWRRRYAAALVRLRDAGLQTTADDRAGAEAYVELRARWYGQIAALAPRMAYTIEEICGTDGAPTWFGERRDRPPRLTAVA